MSERHIKERMAAKNKPWQNMPCQNVPWQNKACLLGTFWAWHLFGAQLKLVALHLIRLFGVVHAHQHHVMLE